MTDPSPPPETPADQAEARAIRKRWITLGEIVAVAGVVIAALGFWNSWEERKDAAAERQTERSNRDKAARGTQHNVALVSTAANAEGLSFKALDCELQAADILFPSALGVGRETTLLDHRIETAWVAKPLLALTDGGDDRRSGTLPVVIAATCQSPDGLRSKIALYTITWRTEPGILGRRLMLRGMVPGPALSGNPQAMLDRLWRKP